MPEISIIVPVYNAEKKLTKCLDSIVGQDYNDMELILIDDYSTDQSFKMCLDYAEKYHWIKAVKSTGKGVSYARNTGLDLATGKIIGFCDADDYFMGHLLADVVAFFKSFPDIDVLIGGIKIVNQGGDIIKSKSIKNPCTINARDTMRYIIEDDNIMGSVCNKFYRRNIINAIRFNTTLSYCEDTHFNMIILENNQDCNCKITDRFFYNYVVNQSSVTHDVKGTYDKKTGENKYIIALYTIEKDCVCGFKLNESIRYKIVQLAIRGLIDMNRTDFDGRDICVLKMKEEIRNNWIYFVLRASNYDIKNNFNLLKSFIKMALKNRLTRRNNE